LLDALLTSGIGRNRLFIGICVVTTSLLLSNVEAEIHERLHRWGFIRGGASPNDVLILRPSFRGLLGLEANQNLRWWRTEVTRPINRDTYRRGLCASLWIVALGAAAGGITFGFLGRAAWLTTTILGVSFGGMLVFLGTLYDVYQWFAIFRYPPSQLFRVR
jgi:hypothetical protein